MAVARPRRVQGVSGAKRLSLLALPRHPAHPEANTLLSASIIPMLASLHPFLDESIPDPTDFPADADAPGLRALDDALRCSICRELYEAPVTVNCSHSHSFCSLVCVPLPFVSRAATMDRQPPPLPPAVVHPAADDREAGVPCLPQDDPRGADTAQPGAGGRGQGVEAREVRVRGPSPVWCGMVCADETMLGRSSWGCWRRVPRIQGGSEVQGQRAES